MDTVKIYKDTVGEWRWSRIAANGNILADSSEGYVNKKDCLDMALHVNGDASTDLEFIVDGA